MSFPKSYFDVCGKFYFRHNYSRKLNDKYRTLEKRSLHLKWHGWFKLTLFSMRKIKNENTKLTSCDHL